jgi:HK97 family phage major capsid protein
MKYEDLIKMSAKDLKSRLKDLNKQANDAKGDVLNKLIEEAEIIDGILADAATRQRMANMAAAAGEEDPEAEGGEGKGESTEEPKDKVRTERGAKLKNGQTVKFNSKKVFPVRNVLSVSQTVTPTATATDVLPTFSNVSSLVDLVRTIPLNGGETYKRGYVKSYGDGVGVTAEGEDYNPTEPVFGYVSIEKEKITAYTEEPEEMVKLPNADYDGVVEGSVTRAIRRYITRQILIGDGSTGKFKGIFYNPTDAKLQVIDPNTDISISTIDDGTLDEIIYSYGGEEDVEDMAVLILNKKDLKAFAKSRDKNGRKVYTIVNHGNTGTIDSVPYVINSACKAISDTATAAGDYLMAYGPLSNYEMAVFSDIDAKKSEDYKFKQGQIAYRADIYAGGSVAAYNGFVRVKKVTV